MHGTQSPNTTHHPRSPGARAGQFVGRYGIGAVIVLSGVVLLLIPGDVGAYAFASAVKIGLAVLLLKAGVSVMLLNLLHRLSLGGDGKRERRHANNGCGTGSAKWGWR